MSKIFHACTLAWVVLMLAAVVGCSPTDPQSLIAKAEAHRQNGAYAAAIIELKNVLQKNPDHGEARYLLGMNYNETGNFGGAEQELRKALELRYDPAKVFPALGKSLLATGEFKKVIDQVKLEGDANNAVQAEILTLRARAWLGLDDRLQARKLLDQALARQPEFADALLVHAQVLVHERQLDAAGKLIERALASAPNSVDAWTMKGDFHRLMNDRGAAEAAYQKVIELRPDNLQARQNIVLLQIAGGNFGEARKQIDDMRKRAPKLPTVSYLQAMLEFRQKNYVPAQEAVQQVLKVAPNHLPSVLLAGMLATALGQHAQAQAHLIRVVERMPGNLEARKLLVSSLARSGELGRAIGLLETGLKQAPDDIGLMILAGELYMQAGEFGRATGYFENAAKRDPKSARALTKLGMSRLASGDTDRALADLETAVQLDPGDYQADVTLVTSYLKQKKYDEALVALRSLEKKQPRNPLTYNLKAAAYVGKGDIASARAALQHALELQPTYAAAAIVLARIDLQEKKPQDARRRLEAILEKDANNVQALLALATFASQIGATPKEEIDWLQRAAKASPNSVEPLLLLARLHARRGEAKQALEIAQQAQRISPDNPLVLDLLGGAQLAAGERQQALTTYARLVGLQPKSAVALLRLAGAQAATENRTAAIATLDKALALKPDFIDAYLALIDLHIRAGQFPQALKTARQAHRQFPKLPLGLSMEGDVWMADKKFMQAAKAYEAAFGIARHGSLVIKMYGAYTLAGRQDEGEARVASWLKESPDDAAVRLFAANNAIQRGNHKEAIAHYERLQQKQSDNVVVLNNLAWAYHQIKDPRALETAERAYKLTPDNPLIVDTLGWILVEQGNTKRGLELLQKAVTAAPKAPEIRYHLAQAWLKAGDKSKARDELERLLAADAKFPQQAEAQALLKQLRN